jgi:hypothetical protein
MRRIPTLALLCSLLIMATVFVGLRPSPSNGSTGPMLTGADCTLTPGILTITICGNTFVNQAGQSVVLCGANSEGTQYDCAQTGAGFFDDPTITGTNFSTEIAALKDWGINIGSTSMRSAHVLSEW